MYLVELLTVKKYLRCGRGNKVKGGFMQKESQKPIKCALEIEAKTSFQRFLASILVMQPPIAFGTIGGISYFWLWGFQARSPKLKTDLFRKCYRIFPDTGKNSNACRTTLLCCCPEPRIIAVMG